jgi:hypothetical protein
MYCIALVEKDTGSDPNLPKWCRSIRIRIHNTQKCLPVAFWCPWKTSFGQIYFATPPSFLILTQNSVVRNSLAWCGDAAGSTRVASAPPPSASTPTRRLRPSPVPAHTASTGWRAPLETGIASSSPPWNPEPVFKVIRREIPVVPTESTFLRVDSESRLFPCRGT